MVQSSHKGRPARESPVLQPRRPTVTAPLRVVIVEDEPLALQHLTRALDRVGGVEVVGSAGHGQAGLERVAEARPDVVILDIKMPGMDGLELADRLPRESAPVVIFVTAFEQFALEAFQRAAVDYLLKPVDIARLGEAIARARLRVNQSTAEERAKALEALVAAMRSAPSSGLEPPGAAIWVTGPRGRQRLPITGIEWFEAQRDYVAIHAGGRTYTQRGTLRDLAGKLDAAVFLRVHRSAIVNLNAITGIERRNWGQYAVRLNTGAEIPIGRAYLPDLRASVERSGVVQIRG